MSSSSFQSGGETKATTDGEEVLSLLATDSMRHDISNWKKQVFKQTILSPWDINNPNQWISGVDAAQYNGKLVVFSEDEFLQNLGALLKPFGAYNMIMKSHSTTVR